MPVITFPSSPSNNQLFIAEGKAMRYNLSKNKWKQVSTLSSSQITDLEARTIGVSSMSLSGNTLIIQKDDSSYSNVSLAAFSGNILTNYSSASLLPLVDLVSGTQVYVTDTNSLFITDGSGWYKVATVNLSPSLTLGVASVSMNAGGSIDVNYTVNEPEDTPYTITASATSNATITVHQSNNTLSFAGGATATSNETITISATDGVNVVGDTLTMTIILPPWSNTTQVFRDTSTHDEQAGWAIDLSSSDQKLVVGKPNSKAGNASLRPGEVEVFDFNTGTNTWTGPIHTFRIGSISGQKFGYAVAIHDNTVVASAPYASHYNSADGAFNTWQLDKYPYPDGGGQQNLSRGNNNNLGRRLQMTTLHYNAALSDSRLLMASTKGVGGDSTGGVSFFYRQYARTGNLNAGNPWTHTSDIQSPDTAAHSGSGAQDFGTDIALVHAAGTTQTDFAVSDSSYNPGSTPGKGRVYIYRGNGQSGSFGPSTINGAALATIDVPASNASDMYTYFGDSISFNGNATTIAIGAPGAHGAGLASPYDSGAVFIYTGGGSSWTLQATLTPSDATLYQRFGHSVDLSDNGNTIAIGSNQASPGGAIYIFERSGSTWSQSGKILQTPADNNPSGDKFGQNVVLTADAYKAVVSGAPSTQSNYGAVYGFKKP